MNPIAILTDPKRLTVSTGKAALLKTLGLPRDISYEEAHDKIIQCIVYARKLGNDQIAAQLSEVNVFLKKHLKHQCESCHSLVHPRSRFCRPCSNSRLLNTQRPYRTYNGDYGITPIVERIVRALDGPFYLDQICYEVQREKPDVPHTAIQKSVYAGLRYMKLRGIISGGGLENWRRYDVVKPQIK